MEYDRDDRLPKVEDWNAWWYATAEYRMVFRLTFPSQCFWFLLYLIAFLFLFPRLSGAQEALTGRGVICNSAAQVAEYVTLKGGDAALNIINARDKSACAILMVAYVRGKDVMDVRANEGAATVTEIVVIAFNDGTWHRVTPFAQFTLFVKPGQEV